MQQFGHAGQQQTAHQRNSQIDQINFHMKLYLLIQKSWSEGVVSKEAASLDHF
jgi:hypothetical protein